jgi:hypothetical protein
MLPFAPRQTGYSADAQPVFYWYISSSWPGKIEFTINESGAAAPLLETQIEGPFEKGIYRIDLKDYDVHLQPETEYEWFLVIIPDPLERSADFLASATVRYVKAPEDLQTALQRTSRETLPDIYAQKGYWYDAMENLCDLIDTDPENTKLRSMRIAILKEEKLSPAVYEDGNI